MKNSSLRKSLYEAMASMEIIDAHEHLRPEKSRIELPVDVFTLFFHYTHGDLRAAGMPEDDYQALFDRSLPLRKRWALFSPFWKEIRWGSYARAALLAAQKFYDCDDINDKTYESLSEKIQQANTPGLYQRVLRDACNIRVALTQCQTTKVDSPLLVPLMPMVHPTETWKEVSAPGFDPKPDVHSLEDHLDSFRKYVRRVKSEGAVGLKMISNPYGEPDRKEAEGLFKKLRDNPKLTLPTPNALRDYIMDRRIAIAAEEDMVIAVHTGYWQDFREMDPLHMIPILQRYPEAKFDVYHIGYPWVREALMLGKGFPNVWTNFCWTHIISQRFAVAALDEAIDLLPMNKILAFGGDYGWPVEKVYGHLVMAREDIAEVVARRIESRRMSESQALQLIHQWFWDNPRNLYRLDEQTARAKEATT